MAEKNSLPTPGRNVPLVYRPSSLGQAMSIYAANPGANIVCGGTSFLDEPHKEYFDFGRVMIDIAGAEELARITIRDRYVDIGPALSLGALASRGKNFLPPLLLKSLLSIGHFAIRNTATIGGNICLTPRTGDLLPVLHVLGAELEIKSYRTTKWYEIREWMKENSDLPGPLEILSRIRLPLSRWNYHMYQRIGYHGGAPENRGSVSILAQVQKEVLTNLRFCLFTPETGLIRNRSWETVLAGQKVPLSAKILSQVISMIRSNLEEIRSLGLYPRQRTLFLIRNTLENIIPESLAQE